MFYELARFYDSFLADKDYVAEVRRLVALARRWGPPAGKTWLDVACGTGRHLEILRRKYSVMGVDASAAMLRHARHRLTGVRLVRADMRTFRLGRTFDVVTCLFGAIGHLDTERDVRRAFRSFVRHLNPGGVLIVEPWIDPQDFHGGYLYLMQHQDPKRLLVRASSSSRRGNRSVLEIDYLVGTPGKGIRHFHEVDVGLMVPRVRLEKIAREAGLRTRFLRRGVRPGRGLLIGVRSRGAPPRNVSS